MVKASFSQQLIRLLLIVVFSLSILVSIYVPAYARQNGNAGSILAFPPDLSQFPNIGFYFGAFDSSGKFIDNLSKPDVQLLENGHSVEINELTKVQPGIQTTVAIIPSSLMANRVTNEHTVYDQISEALVHWMQVQPTGSPDDFSLSIPTGMLTTREKDPARWVQTLQTYQPDFKSPSVNLSSLTQALDLGTDPNPNPYMKRSILLITSLPAQDMLNSLPNLTSMANQRGIRISVWLVTPPKDTATQQAAAPLEEMTRQTGGSFFIFTGSEQLPDYNTDLISLRYLYHVSFNSVARAGGKQQLGIHIGRSDLDISTAPLTYDLTIAPPNPIFLAPPLQIKRAILPNQNNLTGPVIYDTKEIIIKALIEFPDRHPRAIKVSRLYVDDQIVIENMQPPFEQFVWNLEPYTVSGTHRIRIEVEDMMGAVNSSIDMPVDLIVDQPQGFSIARFIPFQGAGFIIIIALLVAGGVLLVVLLAPGIRANLTRLNVKKNPIVRDPLTQPVKIRQERVSAAAHSPTVPRSVTNLSAPARLVRLSESGHPIPASAILLNRREITVGSDASQASCVLEDTSVSGLHARLLYSDGAFLLADNQSVAGTWINYTPVSTLGVQLDHGDVIHIGRVAFRFELSVPPEQKKPRVVSL